MNTCQHQPLYWLIITMKSTFSVYLSMQKDVGVTIAIICCRKKTDQVSPVEHMLARSTVRQTVGTWCFKMYAAPHQGAVQSLLHIVALIIPDREEDESTKKSKCVSQRRDSQYMTPPPSPTPNPKPGKTFHFLA